MSQYNPVDDMPEAPPLTELEQAYEDLDYFIKLKKQTVKILKESKHSKNYAVIQLLKLYKL